ncbi:MAG: YccF domain-containing protein, partial [Mucinivorans sp.]
MKILGNLLWLLFGGLSVAIEYFIGGVVLCCTIIGIPFGLQVFKLGVLSLWPFGQNVGQNEQTKGCLSALMNVLWFFIGGFW